MTERSLKDDFFLDFVSGWLDGFRRFLDHSCYLFRRFRNLLSLFLCSYRFLDTFLYVC